MWTHEPTNFLTGTNFIPNLYVSIGIILMILTVIVCMSGRNKVAGFFSGLFLCIPLGFVYFVIIGPAISLFFAGVGMAGDSWEHRNDPTCADLGIENVEDCPEYSSLKEW